MLLLRRFCGHECGVALFVGLPRSLLAFLAAVHDALTHTSLERGARAEVATAIAFGLAVENCGLSLVLERLLPLVAGEPVIEVCRAGRRHRNARRVLDLGHLKDQ